MGVYFVLDERGEPRPESDIEVWIRWFERADRGVARTVVTPNVTVLTTFSGVDQTPEGTLLLFETRVFGGVLNGEEVCQPTRADALEGHATLVGWCRIGNSPDGGVTEEQIT